MSTEAQLEANTNLFHVYLFPFIGDTSQGNAMGKTFEIEGQTFPLDFHTVTSTWSNKNKPASTDTHWAPQRRPLTEPWDSWDVGSVAQTAAHEVGHVLGLRHDDCANSGRCLMRGEAIPSTRTRSVPHEILPRKVRVL